MEIKKLKKFMPMLLFAAMVFTFTSCDDDEDISYTLNGTWQGNMYMQSSYDGMTYAASYSEICFMVNMYSYTSGDGYWVDFYSSAPWDYVANHIRWNVDNGTIHIHLVEENTWIDIYDYTLDDFFFTGRIYLGGRYVDFQLRHASSPHMEYYEWGDYWHERDDYWGYYSKGNVMFAPGIGDNTKQNWPVRSLRVQEN